MTHPQLKEREGHQPADIFFHCCKTRKQQHALVEIINNRQELSLWIHWKPLFCGLFGCFRINYIVFVLLYLQKIQVPARKSETEYSQTEEPAEPLNAATGWVKFLWCNLLVHQCRDCLLGSIMWSERVLLFDSNSDILIKCQHNNEQCSVWPFYLLFLHRCLYVGIILSACLGWYVIVFLLLSLITERGQ